MADVYVKQNDQRPDLVAQLKSGGTVVDLSGISDIRFHMGTVIDSTVTVLDASTGKVVYRWGTLDLDINAGIYDAEFEVEWGDSDIQTFPSDGNLKIQVSLEIA